MNPAESKSSDPGAPELLRDLLRGLSFPVAAGAPTCQGGQAAAAAVSVGIVGSSRYPAQPPEHCLRTCLSAVADDPAAVTARGCPFLVGAAQNVVDPSRLVDGRCKEGFAVAAQRTAIGAELATLVTVAGTLPPIREEGTAGSSESQFLTAVGSRNSYDLLQHLDKASRLVQRVGQLLAENAGFANEVIQNYEQLNLIFDLTQQISHVTDARAIESLLLDRVARLLSAETVWVVRSDTAQSPQQSSESQAGAPSSSRALGAFGSAAAVPAHFHPAALAAAVDFVRRTRQIHVAWVGQRQVIAGPLVRLDDQVDVVLAARAAGAAEFHSGDMMLIESVLAFGGQIISNTELHERMRRMSLEVTRALVAAIDKKDHYTSGHSERGGFLTRLTAAELGVPAAEQQTMEWAGLLHDVGKIGIPEEILCKPGKLTPEEFEIIKQHPRMGYEILQPIASLGVILDGVLYHHEYPDGSGYPEGLKGDRIPLVARIVHVVDTFDALTSTRAYRKAFSIEQAISIMRADYGTRIDAEVAEAFLRALRNFQRRHPEDFAARFPTIKERECEYVES